MQETTAPTVHVNVSQSVVFEYLPAVDLNREQQSLNLHQLFSSVCNQENAVFVQGRDSFKLNGTPQVSQ